MAFKDILLQISSYPEPSRSGVIQHAVEITAALKAQITAVAFEYDIFVPSSPMGGAFLNVGGMIATEHQKSLENAKAGLAAFAAEAVKHGVTHFEILEKSVAGLVPDAVIDHARVHDLTIIPAGSISDSQQFIAEKVIFGAGRPVLVLPNPEANVADKPRLNRLERIGVAWDSSRPAARSIADAMPILRHAQVVRAITVTHEKTIVTNQSVDELARHLKLHGIELIHDEVNAAGRSIGETLVQYAETHRLDMLVMGAYGHWRLRDFFLGGATKSMIASPTLPIFLSH